MGTQKNHEMAHVKTDEFENNCYFRLKIFPNLDQCTVNVICTMCLMCQTMSLGGDLEL